MIKEPKVSVIIPIHNSESTIQASLSSARRQTLKDIEIICVDNNSDDKSRGIIKSIIAQDNRVILLSEVRQGAGIARNKGLQTAKGEFVFFLDADDLIYDDKTLEKLYNIAKQKKINIVGGSIYCIDQKTGLEQTSEAKYYFEKDGLIKYVDYQFDWGFWRFLYNREFLISNNIEFPPYLRGEDPVFFVNAMIAAEKFYAIKDPTYQYNYVYSGVKHSKKTFEDYEKASQELLDLAKQHKYFELERTVGQHRVPLVSVIVPVFNTNTPRLEECLNSIKNQDYKNIEVIIVDDGSDKETADYIKRYTAPLEWTVLHQKNKGLSAARNAGYKLAKGEYIQFLDSDDFFDRSLISRAVTLAKETKADIVVENFFIKDQHGNSKVALNTQALPSLSKGTFRLTDFSTRRIGTIPYNVWSKFFNKNFLDRHSIRHDEELYRAEDIIFTYKALILADRISLLADPYITYIEDVPESNSATNDKYPLESVKAWKKLYDFLKEKNKYKDFEKDFCNGMVESLSWHLKRLHTHEGMKLLGTEATKLMKDVGVNVKNEHTLLLLLASIDPEYLRVVREMNKEKNRLQASLDILEQDLKSHLGVKRSVKLVLGNIKRYIKN